METTTLAVFSDDIIKYNTWFQNIRSEIIKEEGDERYDEYLRNLFRAYLTCSDNEFIETIRHQKRKWMQGEVKSDYSFRDLLELGRLTFNNLVQDGSWEGNKISTSTTATTKPVHKSQEENKFLALLGEILNKNNTGGEFKGNQQLNSRQYQQWRFENPENKSTKVARGSTMRWCKNDCHSQPMWCGRKIVRIAPIMQQ